MAGKSAVGRSFGGFGGEGSLSKSPISKRRNPNLSVEIENRLNFIKSVDGL